MIDPTQYSSCRDLFAEYQITLTNAQHEKLRIYEEMLIEESERQNITAVRGSSEIWIRHFLDAAYLMRFLPAEGAVLDIGTGGGIPAIPLAIMRPALTVTMLDSEHNKIAFCQRAVDRLQLHASAVSGRAEELAYNPQYRGQFDAAVSRAMANGSMLTELSVPFLKLDGYLLAMKGKQYDPETERFGSAAAALGCSCDEPLGYMLCGEQKYLIRVHKNAKTPEQYPRRFAKIKRSPL